MKLTKRQVEYLRTLADRKTPILWGGPNKAMGNKLVLKGLAAYNSGHPACYAITPEGRAALQEAQE